MKPALVSILPRLPLADTPVHAISAKIVSLYAGDRFLGDVGLIWTSRLALEAFMWYIPMDKPSPREALSLRDALNQWLAEQNVKLWMVVKRDDAGLKKWAKFMGFVRRDEYDVDHTRYVRM